MIFKLFIFAPPPLRRALHLIWHKVLVIGYNYSNYRVQSTEYRVYSTEYRVQSTEYRTQITEYRTQITEYRIHVFDVERIPSYLFCKWHSICWIIKRTQYINRIHSLLHGKLIILVFLIVIYYLLWKLDLNISTL